MTVWKYLLPNSKTFTFVSPTIVVSGFAYPKTFIFLNLVQSFSFSLSFFQWLCVVSLAVLYNIVFVIGRAVFWEINRQAPELWWTLDYLCDLIYMADTLVHLHEGE
jgi:hypothetical protein